MFIKQILSFTKDEEEEKEEGGRGGRGEGQA